MFSLLFLVGSGDWFGTTVEVAPLYFETSKMMLWAAAADVVVEAIDFTRNQLSAYFDQSRRNILEQVTGKYCISKLCGSA